MASPGEKDKLTWLLILQGWAILWVIIAHSIPFTPSTGRTADLQWHHIARILFFFANSFAMPLFFMISGYLLYMTRISKQRPTSEMLCDKFMRLGIPYIAFITLALGIKMLFPGEVRRMADPSLLGFVGNYLRPFQGVMREMWFVADLLIYFLLYPLYSHILNSKYTIILTLLAGLCMFAIPLKYLTSWLSIDRAVHYFIFFFTGILIRSHNLDSRISNPKLIGIFGALTLIQFSLWLSVPYRVWIGLHLSLPFHFCACFTFWGLAIIIDRRLTSNLFRSFRNYSYQIFLIGIFAQTFVRVLAKRFDFPGSYPLWWTLCVVSGIYFPVIIARIPFLRRFPLFRRIIGL